MLFRLPHSKKEGFVSSPVKSVSLLTTRSSNTNLTDNRFESLRWQDDLHLYIVRQWNSWLYLWTALCMYIYFVIDAITCTVAPFVFFQVWETWLFHPCIYKSVERFVVHILSYLRLVLWVKRRFGRILVTVVAFTYPNRVPGCHN